MRFTVLDPQPTCGAGLRLDNAGGAVVLICTSDQGHVDEHEDDDGNRWRLAVEGVLFRWGGRTRLPL